MEISRSTQLKGERHARRREGEEKIPSSRDRKNLVVAQAVRQGSKQESSFLTKTATEHSSTDNEEAAMGRGICSFSEGS